MIAVIGIGWRDRDPWRAGRDGEPAPWICKL